MKVPKIFLKFNKVDYKTTKFNVSALKCILEKKIHQKFVSSKIISTFATANKQGGICPDGGIGRRAGLKHQWSNPSRFDPGLGTKMERSFYFSLFSFRPDLIIYTHLSIISTTLHPYHIPHSTKTFTAIYLE